MKPKYLVVLNWYGEVHKIYTSSDTKNGALENAFHRLAKRTGNSKSFIKNKFKGNKDNYKVTERTSK